MIQNLKTDRLVMRGYCSHDLTFIHDLVTDRDVIRYLPRTDPWPLKVLMKWLESQYSHWQTHAYGWWILHHINDDIPIGWCGLRMLEDTDEVEVLYLLSKRYWNKGLATEAVERSLRYSFGKAGLSQIIGLVHQDNFASKRVLEKCGFQFKDKVHRFGMDLQRYLVTLVEYDSRPTIA
jgi:RimJ/RimL family protein N-acetyltransferase